MPPIDDGARPPGVRTCDRRESAVDEADGVNEADETGAVIPGDAAEAVAEFARTGALGEFGLDTRARIEALGEGARVAGRHAWPKWYVVGDAEITVCGCGMVQAVSLGTHRETIRVPRARGVEPATHVGPVTLGRLARALARHGLRSRPESRQAPGGLYLEVVETGVHLVFGLEPGLEPIRHSVGAWSPNHLECPGPGARPAPDAAAEETGRGEP
jgi:hypothetical protein